MPVDPALLTRIYPIAWSALGFIFVYYVVVALVLRWRPRRISVPRYEPPQGVNREMRRQEPICSLGKVIGV